ncbi:hypothetical protein [Streptomyces sp. HNM0574]|uniref:YczE/YyaS/YitT family protein n=1 Tax=Streptomyces sp. HNM0574 TaxID=2714954 RepID=UPI00146CA8A5|nr:hypothetical protein [Streptomyces sp. HNM0574]NLU68534.1 hypothetical protein [Streptomyces sp. HNM0574]
MSATDPPRIAKYLVYLAGCAVFSSGAYLFIHSELGADPLDVFALGLMEHLPVTVGLAQTGVALVCLATVALWTRSRPLLAPMLTFFLCGSVIDLLLWADPADLLTVHPAGLLILASMLCAYGSALIIMSSFGIRAIDLLAITMTRKWRWPFWAGKGSIEVTLLVTGILMGGPAGIGTVAFLAAVGLLIQPLVRANVRFLGIPNLGLPDRKPAEAV